MYRMLPCSVLVVLALAAGAAPALSGQDSDGVRSWSFGLWVTGGYQWPNGRLAKNAASDNPNLGLLEVVSELGPSPVVGGGLELRVPTQDMVVRLGFEALPGVEVSGQVGVCDLFGGELCEPEVASASVRAPTLSVHLLAGNPVQAVRPKVSAGFGLRSFDIALPPCPPISTDDVTLVCHAVSDLYRDPGRHYFLRAGVGLQADAGPLSVSVDVLGTTGQYNGGAGRTDGNWYHDVGVRILSGIAVY